MKEQILTYLNMKDILDRYGIKHRGSQFCCPFHGTDKHPSPPNSLSPKVETIFGFT